MKGATEQARRYAVRRVNPFEGVLQVVDTGRARAYSPNGVVWQVQVLSERPDHTWRSISHASPVEQFFNFGLWDADGGLQRIPANPVMDIGAMTDAAERLVTVLHDVIDRQPFKLIDRYECWATNANGDPIALLASTEEPAIRHDLRIVDWQAARNGDRGFESAALTRSGVPASDADSPRHHAERLEQQVHRRAMGRAWFQRDAQDRSGSRLDGPDNEPPLASDRFPPLGLATDWPRASETELVRDYISWRAPRLLMLQDLDDGLRAWLEPLACRQASELAACHRLIPRIIDHDLIEAARVEARLRRAAL